MEIQDWEGTNNTEVVILSTMFQNPWAQFTRHNWNVSYRPEDVNLTYLPELTVDLGYETFDLFQNAAATLKTNVLYELEAMITRMGFEVATTPLLWTTYDLLMIGTLDTTDLRISFQAYFLKFMRYRENADPGVWKAVMNVNDLMMERLEMVCRVYISSIKSMQNMITPPQVNLPDLCAILQAEALLLLGNVDQFTGVLGKYVFDSQFEIMPWKIFRKQEWTRFREQVAVVLILKGLLRDNIEKIISFLSLPTWYQ